MPFFEMQQQVPLKPLQAFEFFSNPYNLEAITPPWLNFKILKLSTPRLGEGSEITYRLKLHGIPLTWRSLIRAWEPPHRFIDEQLVGPYKTWIHEHTLIDHPQGTLIKDRVEYALPLGRLGNWVAGPWVRRDINKIFNYRFEQIARLCR